MNWISFSNRYFTYKITIAFPTTVAELVEGFLVVLLEKVLAYVFFTILVPVRSIFKSPKDSSQLVIPSLSLSKSTLSGTESPSRSVGQLLTGIKSDLLLIPQLKILRSTW